MKRAIIASALLACLATPSSAAIVVWQGDMFVTAVNDANACGAVNMRVGDFARSVFRPKGVSTNGASDLISFVFGRSAIQVVPTTPAGGSLNGATAATVRIVYGSAGFLQFNGNALGGTTTVTPPTLTTSTASVAISVTINNLFSSAVATPSGCNVTFTGTLAKRP